MNEPTMEELRSIVQEHVEEDRASFAELKAADREAHADRKRLIDLTEAQNRKIDPVHAAIVGDVARNEAGLAERQRVVEAKIARMEVDRDWMRKMLWATAAGGAGSFILWLIQILVTGARK